MRYSDTARNWCQNASGRDWADQMTEMVLATLSDLEDGRISVIDLTGALRTGSTSAFERVLERLENGDQDIFDSEDEDFDVLDELIQACVLIGFGATRNLPEEVSA